MNTLTYLYLSLYSIVRQTAYRNRADVTAEKKRMPSIFPNILIPHRTNAPTIGGWSK